MAVGVTWPSLGFFLINFEEVVGILCCRDLYRPNDLVVALGLGYLHACNYFLLIDPGLKLNGSEGIG